MILQNVLKEKAFKKIADLVEQPINQPDKADKYKKILKERGFKQLDMGTNRQIFIHKEYPGVVFKVALDEQGILDNLNEYEKSDKSRYFPQSYDIDRTGYILVQKRVPVIDYDDFQKDKIQKRIREILKELDRDGFVLMDLGSDKHKNYGMDKNGDIYIIDFGYVEYKSLANFNCPSIRYRPGGGKSYCKGKLKYNKTFTMMKCNECDSVFKVDVVLEGYTYMMYADPPKDKGYFSLTPELEEFYQKFNSTRDRSTLQKYVELSNKTYSEKGDIGNMSSPKNVLLRKLRGSSVTGKISDSEVMKEDVPQTVRHRSQYQMRGDIAYIKKHDRESAECTEDEKYDISTSPAIHDEEVRDRIEELIDQGEYHEAAKVLIESRFSSDDADEIIKALFFERNPELKDIIDEHQNMQSSEKNEEENDDTRYFNTESLCSQVGIALNLKDGELHLGMVAEELRAKPVVVISKNDTVYYIDILAHLEQLAKIQDEDDTRDMIVTFMSVKPLNEFNGDYENEYFTDETEVESDEGVPETFGQALADESCGDGNEEYDATTPGSQFDDDDDDDEDDED